MSFVLGTRQATCHGLVPSLALCLSPLSQTTPRQRGEEDLAGAIAHARMSLSEARSTALALGACILHLHEQGIVHADVKPLNAIRVGGRWKIIDLDAAAPVESGFLGLKSSTAVSWECGPAVMMPHTRCFCISAPRGTFLPFRRLFHRFSFSPCYGHLSSPGQTPCFHLSSSSPHPQYIPPELLYREAGDILPDELVVDEGGVSTRYSADGTIVRSKVPTAALGAAIAAAPAGAAEKAPEDASKAKAVSAAAATAAAAAAAVAATAPATEGGGGVSVFRVPGGAGWRVRGVDERGLAIDARQRGRFEGLRARPSFDVWCGLALSRTQKGSLVLFQLFHHRWGKPTIPSAAAIVHIHRRRGRSEKSLILTLLTMFGLCAPKRSFGVILYDLLVRGSLWHADVDSNLQQPADYCKLAEWSPQAARDVIDSRVPDRWAQALLLRLLSADPSARPASMSAVLRHPFFRPSQEAR